MLSPITEAICDGNIYDIADIVRAGLAAEEPPQQVLKAMTDGLDLCGQRFETGEYFLPELMMASEAFTEGMSVLEPHLAHRAGQEEGKVVLGTVAGDVHSIGKDLVGFLLKSAGFEVVDIGTDNSTERIVQAVKEHRPDVLGMSALLTTTMQGMSDVVQALEEQGLREQTKVIIGGGPVSERFAQQIGVDAYAADAVEGVRKIKQLVGR